MDNRPKTRRFRAKISRKTTVLLVCDRLIDLGIGLVRLASVDAFVRLAVGAQTAFDRLDEPEREAALFDARFRANRAFNALLGHLFVFFGDMFHDCILTKQLSDLN